METDVFEYVNRGHTVVCASSRLARRLKHRYAQIQIRLGRRAWATPDILPWSSWMRRSWDDMGYRKEGNQILLSAEQQLYIWQRLIQASHGGQLLQLPATARQALKAWDIVRDWEIPVFPEATACHCS